jgi:hypothetical protein
MTTTAMSWFYRAPEKVPYFIAERVNTTFWDARIAGVMLRVERAEPPIRMTGSYSGSQVTMEWEPTKWLRLSTCPAAPALANGLANILRRKPALRYDSPDGDTIWEWWIEGVDKRWQELQGKPAFKNPQRLDGSQ